MPRTETHHAALALFDGLKTDADVDALSPAEVVRLCQWNDPNGEWYRMAPSGVSLEDALSNLRSLIDGEDPETDQCAELLTPAVEWLETLRDFHRDDDEAPTLEEAREAIKAWVREDRQDPYPERGYQTDPLNRP